MDTKVDRDEIPLTSAAVRPTPPSSGRSMMHGHSDMYSNDYENIYDNALVDVSDTNKDSSSPNKQGQGKPFRSRYINDLTI